MRRDVLECCQGGLPFIDRSSVVEKEKMGGVARSITLCCTVRDICSSSLFTEGGGGAFHLIHIRVCRQKRERGIKAKSGTKNIISLE